MAPEILEGSGMFSKAADVYALAMVAYEVWVCYSVFVVYAFTNARFSLELLRFSIVHLPQ